MVRVRICGLVLFLIPQVLFAGKRVDIPGYTFSQLTDNAEPDRYPRVSSDGLVVWVARYQLPGAGSAITTDAEVMLYDGNTIEQVTDNDVSDERPVVNDLGEVAWQRFGGQEQSEILMRTNGEVLRVTDDAFPTTDRYPDINDNGFIVWGRSVAGRWHLAVFDPVPASFALIGEGYRPHINALNHITVGQDAIIDTTGNVVQEIPTPASLGYSGYRRREINDLGQLALEADPGATLSPDFVGPRDILFWDGSRMHLVYRSPGPWVGRADLNAAGVIVFEGYGSLPGSLSGGNDREIWVFDPAIGTVIQLTDDDVSDVWGTVTNDGRVLWWGIGNYPGASSPDWDSEILVATPTGDADEDGVSNEDDNCPLAPNPTQEDSGGIGAVIGDGIGDACQCGDVSGDGSTNLSDALIIAYGRVSSGNHQERLGDVNGDGSCNITDALIIARGQQGSAREDQHCPAYYGR